MQFIYAVLICLVVFLFIIGIRVFGGAGLKGVKKIIPLSAPNGVFTVLLVIAGIIVFCFGIYSSSLRTPRADEIGTLVWERWFWVLILWGILAALIALKAGKAAKTLQWVLAGVMIMAFIIFPIGSWIAGPSSSQQKLAQALPQNAPDLPWAWHMDQSKWPRVQVPPHGDSVHVPSIFGGHIVWGGSGFKVHYVYSDGHECVIGDTSPSCGDGNIVEGYAHNDGDTVLYASYAYARVGEK